MNKKDRKAISRAAAGCDQTAEQWLAGHNAEGLDPINVANVCNESRDILAGIISRALKGKSI